MVDLEKKAEYIIFREILVAFLASQAVSAYKLSININICNRLIFAMRSFRNAEGYYGKSFTR